MRLEHCGRCEAEGESAAGEFIREELAEEHARHP